MKSKHKYYLLSLLTKDYKKDKQITDYESMQDGVSIKVVYKLSDISSCIIFIEKPIIYHNKKFDYFLAYGQGKSPYFVVNEGELTRPLIYYTSQFIFNKKEPMKFYPLNKLDKEILEEHFADIRETNFKIDATAQA